MDAIDPNLSSMEYLLIMLKVDFLHVLYHKRAIYIIHYSDIYMHYSAGEKPKSSAFANCAGLLLRALHSSPRRHDPN